jgi:hypothetical protein
LTAPEFSAVASSVVLKTRRLGFVGPVEATKFQDALKPSSSVNIK